MSIIIYSKPDCVQCNATYRAFDKQGIDYQVIDLTQDQQALNHVKSLGYQQVPVIIAGDDHWSGSGRTRSARWRSPAEARR